MSGNLGQGNASSWRALSWAAATVAGLALFSSPALAFCFCAKCVTETFDTYQPMSSSMKPAIEPGACVIVKNRAAVDRGSIIVFRHPIIPDQVFVKRLIGLPGDTIEMRGGELILNGEPVLQTATAAYLQVFRQEGPYGLWPRCPTLVAAGETCEIDRWTESLGSGVRWDVLNLDADGYADTFGPVTVPVGHVFVMGDHRDNSNDSRVPQEAGGLGFIPVGNILGPVVEIANP